MSRWAADVHDALMCFSITVPLHYDGRLLVGVSPHKHGPKSLIYMSEYVFTVTSLREKRKEKSHENVYRC